jgi:hypothetical protein
MHQLSKWLTNWLVSRLLGTPTAGSIYSKITHYYRRQLPLSFPAFLLLPGGLPVEVSMTD